jgi:hypothetical protein
MEEEEYTNPYDMFVYGIRSSYTKESFFRRLHRFVDLLIYAKRRLWRNVVTFLVIACLISFAHC